MLQSSPTIIITFSRPHIYFVLSRVVLKVSVIIANILTFLIGTAYIKKFFKYTPTAKKTCFIRQFYFCAEKVIFLARNRLRALIVLIFAHDMQIHVAHALCKQGCRLISYTAGVLQLPPVSPTGRYKLLHCVRFHFTARLAVCSQS